MKNNELIQKIQLEIMDEIHNTCLENSIKYYMVGGTLIGALRHKGFIPWDIDIDISMPRDDYEKFKIVFINKYKNTKFEYIDYSIEKCFFKPHAIVRNKNTHIHFCDDKNNLQDYGVFIDIFPLDLFPNDVKKQKIISKKIDRLKLIMHYKTSITKPKNKIKRFFKPIVRFGLKLININKIQNKFLTITKKYSDCDSNILCNYVGRYALIKEAHNNEIWGTPTLVNFCDRKYYAPEKSDEYLRKIYGDYMKLPSIEEQNEYYNCYDNVEVLNK